MNDELRDKIRYILRTIVVIIVIASLLLQWLVQPISVDEVIEFIFGGGRSY